ncbi:MAG: hypothetical protein WAL80_17665 [Xanthobacteraceae bacterium]
MTGKLGTVALVIALLGILAASIWLAVHTWTSVGGPPMPIHGIIAMTLGIVFSLLVGCGLMTLVFYSSRHGYDDQAYGDRAYDERAHDDQSYDGPGPPKAEGG